MQAHDCFTISVKPLPEGWFVECEPDLCVQLFRSGGAAERSAVRLAAAFAKCGRNVRVVIHDRRGLLAGSLDANPCSGDLRRWRVKLH
jgi:hypothetical protein